MRARGKLDTATEQSGKKCRLLLWDSRAKVINFGHHHLLLKSNTHARQEFILASQTVNYLSNNKRVYNL